MRKQLGMTLIEIMIALLIGAFLMGGILQVFISAKQSYRMQDNLSRLQENARYAMEIVSHDIRLAGYLGCSGISSSTPRVIANAPLVTPNPHVYTVATAAAKANIVKADFISSGNNNNGTLNSPSPALATTPLNTVIAGTDAITVQFAEPCGGNVIAPVTTAFLTVAKVSPTNTCGKNTIGAAIPKGTPLIIDDCTKSHVFRAVVSNTDTSQNTDKTNTATLNLEGKTYNIGSEIMMLRSYTYFIRQSGISHKSKNGLIRLPALWRLDNNNLSNPNPVELIEGIENMQISYNVGIGARNADGTFPQYQYKDAPLASDLPRIESVRVVLTVESVDDSLTSSGDGRLRRTFTSTLDLRNLLK